VRRDRAGAVEMHHLASGVNAAVGSTSRHNGGGAIWVQLSQGPLQRFLDAGVPGLALPAAVGRAVVLQAEGDAPKPPCWRRVSQSCCTKAIKNRAEESPPRGADDRQQVRSDPRTQTSSMIAISALSPRRGTVRMMRV